ncbi:hypothetical protein ACSDYA_001839 [Campylobacter upsaliensis]|nr:hypothetical protein [Campylobacter upsaliensis]HEC1237850.1 hypothetical protein [Campylobacter upsaliensis]HEC1575225.1 hypothetical protein [Campylobacter upsaliensis]
MSIIQAINYLNEYANTLSNDDNFKEFSNKLFTFAEKMKSEKNINDKDIFIKELQEEILKNYEEDKDYKDFFLVQASALALEMDANNFVEMENYYKNFQKAYEKFKDEKSLKEFYNELDTLDETKTNQNQDELVAELLQNIDFNENFSLEKEELEHQVSSYETALLNDDFITPSDDDFKEENENIKPSELIAFIKDENQISYPFNREDTLKNASFMRDFRKELNALGTKELEEMVNAMRAKNEALKKELEALKSKKEDLLRQLQGEMVANSNLSLAKDELDINQTQNVDEELKVDTQDELKSGDEVAFESKENLEQNHLETNPLFEKMAEVQENSQEQNNAQIRLKRKM